MKFKTLFVAAFATLSLITMGCGGGGSDDIEDPDPIARTLLVGTGDSTTLTTKKWRTIFMKVNDSYIGTGADQPCPVELKKKTGGETTSCDPNDYLELRSDGKSRSSHEGTLEPDFDDTWQLSGSTLTAVTNSPGGTDRVVSTFALTNEGIVDGKQRLRLNTLSETEPDGVTPRPGEAGFEFVIEEI